MASFLRPPEVQRGLVVSSTECCPSILMPIAGFVVFFTVYQIAFPLIKQYLLNRGYLALTSQGGSGPDSSQPSEGPSTRLFWILQWGSALFGSIFSIISSTFFLDENLDWSSIHVVTVLANWFYWYCTVESNRKRSQAPRNIPVSSSVDACMVLLNFFSSVGINLLSVSCMDTCRSIHYGVAACPRGSPLAVMNIVFSSTVIGSIALVVLAKFCDVGVRATFEAVFKD